MALFVDIQVRDATTGQLMDTLRGRQVQIVEHGTPTPVPITDISTGETISGSTVTVNSAFTVSFETPGTSTTDDVHTVDAVGPNGIRTTLRSYEALVGIAEAAAAASTSAASEAATVATRTMQLKGNATTGISFWGTFTAETAPGAADGVAVGDLGVLLT